MLRTIFFSLGLTLFPILSAQQVNPMEWILKGDYVRALTEANSQLSQGVGDPDIYFVKAVALQQLKRFREADSSYIEAIQLDSGNLSYKESRINCLIELEKYELAEKLAKEIIGSDSLRVTPWLQLSSIYQKQGRFTEAIAANEFLGQQDSTNTYFVKQCGFLYMRMDSIDLSIKKYERALVMDSSDFSLFPRLGQLYVRGEHDDKLPVLSWCISKDSTEALLYRFRGSLFLMKEMYPEAGEDFQLALQLGDTSAFTFRHMGLSLFQMAEYDSAMPFFVETIRHDPQDPQAWYYLAVCYKWQENLPKAIECLETSLKLTIPPSLAAIYSGLGQFHGLMRHFDLAMDQYKMSIAIDPKQQIPYAQLGILTEESGGDKKTALAYYEKFLEVYTGLDISLRNYVNNRITVIKERLFMEADSGK